jgi:hypothetical protein
MMWPELTMFSRAALRLPRKSCGLFDTGLAGGSFDVTSFNYDASTGPPLEDVVSANTSIFDVYAETKSDTVRNMMNTSPDLLSDIHIDQLANENLDAFINLDQYLQDLFFDDITDPSSDEVFQTQNTMIPTSKESNIFSLQASVMPELYTQKSTVNHLTFEPATTGMFEIPMHENMVSDSLQDYNGNRTGQFENISVTLEDIWNRRAHDDSQRRPVLKSTLSSSDSSTWSDSLDSHIQNTADSLDSHIQDTADSLDSHIQDTANSPDSHSLDSNIQDTATDKSAAIRNKNRDLSQKSRERRKPKFADLDDEAVRLVEANAKLRQKIIQLEEMTRTMKAQLISSIVGN